MTIATLKYDLNDNDDAMQFKLASDSKNLWLALWNIDMAFRDHEKYEKRIVDREYFREILNENLVNLDDY